MDTGHWIFDKNFDPDDWFGFLYRIIDKDTKQEYIGKKQFHQHLRKVVKNRKNRKRVTKPSNWKKYTSSSTHVNLAIEEKGMDNFIFLIESLHKSKGSLTYAEVKMQIVEGALTEKFEDGTPKFYNKQVAAVKFMPPPEDDDEAKMKIKTRARNRLINEALIKSS